MKIIKPLTLGILHKPFKAQGQNHLCVVALGFFKLSQSLQPVESLQLDKSLQPDKSPQSTKQPSHRFEIESQAYPQVLPQLPQGQPLDMVMPKGQSEFLLCGHAYSPDNKPVTQLNAGMQVGEVSKVLRVIGDRDWYYGELSAFKISQPKPFTKMPVGYERAFGGADYAYNRVGLGYSPNRLAFLYGQRNAPMPNLEYPQTPITGHRKEYMPASFGPMDIMWKQRFKWVGTYDEHWIKNNFPNLADDADMRLHNQAAEDQRVPKPLKGGEPYQLRCLHPQHPEISGHLPNFRVRGVLQTENTKETEQGGKDKQIIHQSLQFHADTVWFFPDTDLGVMLYRAVAPVSTPDATDAKALLLAYEHEDESPRADSHYIEQISARMDRQRVAGQVLNEAALIPTQPESVKLEREKKKQARVQVSKDKTNRIIAELEKDLDVPDVSASSSQKPKTLEISAPEVPEFQMPEELQTPLSLEDIANGGIDLSSALKKIDDQKTALQAVRDEELAKLKTSLAEQLSGIGDKESAGQKDSESDEESWKKALEKASQLPLDLHPDLGNYSSDVEQLIELLEFDLGKSAEAPADKEPKENLDKFEALQRASKRAQTTLNKEREKLPEALSIKLGTWLAELVLEKQPMAGRDLSDVIAPGINLSGMDLREVNFEGADLSRANFENANLFGANFLGAKIEGANFSHANLEEANLSQSQAKNVCFNNAKLIKTLAVEANLAGASFLEANLTKAMLNKAELTGANFSKAQLLQTLMGEVKAASSLWIGAEMTQTVLPKAQLEGANFSEAKLERVICAGVQASCSLWRKSKAVRSFFGGESVFTKSDWRGAVFKTCGFRGVDLKEINAKEATFFQCDFGNADISHSNLASAVLCRSLFSEANLQYTDLRNSDFHQGICRGTDFTEADLSESSLVLADMSHAVLLNTRLKDVVERVS